MSTRAPLPRTHRRVRRRPGSHTRRDSASRASTISSASSAAKSLSAIPPLIAPDLHARLRSRRCRWRRPPLSVPAPARRRRTISIAPRTSPLRELPECRIRPYFGIAVLAPEGRKDTIEDREALRGDGRAARDRRDTPLSRSKVDMSQRFDDVEHSSRVEHRCLRAAARGRRSAGSRGR